MEPKVAATNASGAVDEVATHGARELLVPSALEAVVRGRQIDAVVTAIDDWAYALDYAEPLLLAHFGAASLDGFGLGDLLAQCDASAADLEKFTPSELAPLVAACRELNPFFFRVRAVVSFRSASEVLAAVEQMSLTAPAAS